jgi:hypothetical protein
MSSEFFYSLYSYSFRWTCTILLSANCLILPFGVCRCCRGWTMDLELTGGPLESCCMKWWWVSAFLQYLERLACLIKFLTILYHIQEHCIHTESIVFLQLAMLLFISITWIIEGLFVAGSREDYVCFGCCLFCLRFVLVGHMASHKLLCKIILMMNFRQHH